MTDASKKQRKSVTREGRNSLTATNSNNSNGKRGSKKENKRKSKTDVEDASDAELEANRNKTAGDDQKRASSSKSKTDPLEDEEEFWGFGQSTPKMLHTLEEYGEMEEDIILPPVYQPPPEKPPVAGPPEIWIRLRPCPRMQDNIFEVLPDGRGVQLIPHVLDEYDYKGRKKPFLSGNTGIPFNCNGVLRNTSQEETFNIIAHDVVEKAMDGVSGLVLGVGSEISGKYFTLFGSLNKFQYRGIIPRCLEKIFQICAAKSNEMRYLIRMAIVEIRCDKIRDLLTLGSCEGNPFNKDSPHGMIFQKIGAAEHGFGLLIRALTCQREIPREPYAKPHTLVFIDIYGESFKPHCKPKIVKSRITFAKIAPIPERDAIFPPLSRSFSDGCSGPTCNKMGCRKKRTGPAAEAIHIRQDIAFLAQLCKKACRDQKLRRYYERLRRIGINVCMPKKANHFRLSKLTYCLKDIVSGNCEIRIVLHIRPERQYKHSSLETFRFADHIKCIPFGLLAPGTSGNKTCEDQVGPMLNDAFTLHDFLSKIPQEISDLYIQVYPGTFRTVRDHALALFDNRIHSLEDGNPVNPRELFDKFRSLWLYATETGMIPTTIPGAHQDLEAEEMEALGKRSASTMVDNKEEAAPTPAPPPTQAAGVKPEEELLPPPTPPVKKTPSGRKAKGGKSKGDLKGKGSKKKLGKSKSKSRGRGRGKSPAPTRGSTEDTEAEGEIPGRPPPTAVDADLEKQGQTPTDVPDERPGTTIGEVLGPTIDGVGGMEGEVPGKEEAWQEFLHTTAGMEMFEDLSSKSKALHEVVVEQTDTTKQASYIFSRLNNLQKELNLIQQDRFVRGDEYDVQGNIIVAPREKQLIQDIKILEQTRDELTVKLQHLKERVQVEKSKVELAKLDTEVAFQNFALDNYAIAFEDPFRANEVTLEKNKQEQADEDAERVKKFEDIKRVAKKQARLFLRALAKKPSWVPY